MLLIIGIVLLFIFVVNFSIVESRYECQGELTFMGEKEPKTVYTKLEEYRWWVGLWGESDGNLSLEIPNVYVDYYGHIKETGDQLQIYDWDMNLVGNFSTLSKTLALNSRMGFFDGACIKIDD